MPASFDNVTVTTKANVYFDGKVISHGILLADGRKKSLGIIFPGEYHFGTVCACERLGKRTQPRGARPIRK